MDFPFSFIIISPSYLISDINIITKFYGKKKSSPEAALLDYIIFFS